MKGKGVTRANESRRRLPARLTWAFVCVAITCAALAQRTGFIIDGVSTNAGASFYVGDTNPFNFLLITNGGTLMDQTGIIGNTESAPNNVAIVSGVGSHWNSDSNLFVGLSGSWNRLEVVAGGLVNMDGVVYPHEAIYVGYNVSSSDNSVLVKGTDSVLGRAKFYLGYSGSGNRIDLLDGGRIESTHTSGLGSGWPSYIGFSVSSSSNTAFVSGTNSVWNSDHLYLGFAGSQNSLVIAGGGKVACAVLYVGYETSSHRNGLLVTGTNSTWIGQLRIGGGSSNNVVVNEGARVESVATLIGAEGGTGNSLLVSGQGSYLGSGRFLNLEGSDNRFLAEKGAQVESWAVYVGWASAMNSNVACLKRSRWNAGGLFLGRGEDPNLSLNGGSRNAIRIEDGSDVECGSGGIGGTENVLLVSGAGSRLSVEDFRIGWRTNSLVIRDHGVLSGLNLWLSSSSSELIIANGGSVSATSRFNHGAFWLTEGVLVLDNGLLNVDQLIAREEGPTEIDFRSGVLQLGSSIVNSPKGLVVGDGLNTATLELRDGTRTGGVTGWTVPGVHIVPNGLTISTNARLLGTGTVAGAVSNSGTIAPGKPLGSLTINGDLLMQGSARLSVEIGGTNQAVDFDFINVSNTVHLVGMLQISLINRFIPAGTDTFPILRFASATGAFGNAPNGGRVKTANKLGSFRVDYEAQSVRLTDYQSTDVDADGIEDAWALQHFGHSPLSAAERDADADNDGLCNYGEFVAGTNPSDATSAFKVLSVTTAIGGAVTLRFSGDDDKLYRIWESEDLKAWTEVSTPNSVTQAPGIREWTGSPVSLSVPGFYRVSVE